MFIINIPKLLKKKDAGYKIFAVGEDFIIEILGWQEETLYVKMYP